MFRMINPLVSIDAVDFKCVVDSVALTAKDIMADESSFCQPGLETASMAIYTLKLTGKIRFGVATTATWNKLIAVARTQKTVILEPTAGVATVSNPRATFDIVVPTISFLDGKVGETSPFELEAIVIGAPVFATA